MSILTHVVDVAMHGAAYGRLMRSPI